MFTVRWIQMDNLLLLICLVAAASGQHSSLIVRIDDEATVPCENVKHGQHNCDSINWLFIVLERNTVTLFEHGQMQKEADRLNVTAGCALVIKKVTDQDVGRYTCRQFISGSQHSDSFVFLFFLHMTEQKDNDKLILSCNVFPHQNCSYTVEWLYQGKEEISNSDMEISPGDCSSTVTFRSSTFKQTIYESLKCNVTNKDTKSAQLFPFTLKSSGDKTGGDERTATTKSTTTVMPTSAIRSGGTTLEDRTTSNGSYITFTNKIKEKRGWSWWFIVVLVGLAALTVIAVIIIRQKTMKGNKRQREENTTEPGVSYASINLTRKSKTKAQVLGDGADDGDTVTYSTVKAFSTSGVFCDPSSLYSTVNKPKK